MNLLQLFVILIVMKVTLYSEPSIDGFIATTDHDTSWVFKLDSGEFDKFIESQNVVLMGKQTFIFAEEDGDFPYDGPYNIVFTSDKELLEKPKSERYRFTDKAPAEVIEQLRSDGYQKVGVIGGGILNGSMIKSDLIDEIVLIYHPIILGDGKKLFEGADICENMELISTEQLPQNLIKTTYDIKR